MGQQLFKVNFEKFDSNNKTNSSNFDAIRSCIENDQINLLFPWKINSENILIKQIRNDLFQLTNSKDLKEIDKEINEILLGNVFSFIENNYQQAITIITKNWEKQQQLQKSLIDKLKEEQDENILLTDDNHEKFSYFALQSLISILLILIKSTEKSDPTIINQILSLTNQLTQQIPVKYFSSSNNSNLLFKSLKPLIDYFEQLSLSTDLILSKKSIEILLHFSITKRSFKDILPLLSRLIFDKTNQYDLRNLIIQLNNNLTEIIQEKNEQDETSLEYLKSIEVFPNTKLMELDDKQLTGEFLSSIIFSHIYLNNSFEFEFDPNTFKQLFNIIEQLIRIEISDSNKIVNYILIISIKLFRIHLEYLFNTTTKIYQNILSIKQYDLIDLITNDEELIKWFDLFLKLATDEQNENLCQEASKTFIFIIEKKFESFIDKLLFIQQFIIENKYQILIKQFFIELNKQSTILNWIQILLNDENSDQLKALKILFSFIDIYFDRNDQQIEQILLSFQHILLFKLIQQSLSENNVSTSLVIQYLTYIFKKFSNENQLINEILVGLFLVTEVNDSFHFETIQSIFTPILPLLSKYFLNNSITNHPLICSLLGKMSRILIISSPLNSLEEKYINELNSPIFAGGCEINDIESSSDDHKLLMSIYNNKDEGAKLITKIKKSLKVKEHFLQKSIEEQSNDACASIFAVYIKYYRRINLVRINEEKVHHQLLSLYKYANSIHNLFANLKGQGGDCNEFYQQIKQRTLFLLLNIKENNFIPIIEQEDLLPEKKEKIQFQRQISRWTKAKYIIRLLRNLLKACSRFRKLILQKKTKFNYENILHQSIQHFICEKTQLDLNELKQCFQRQYQRAKIRLFNYQFIIQFIQNISNLDNQNEILPNLIFYFSSLENCRLESSYLENISTVNSESKEEIRQCYYSIVKLILSSKCKSEILIFNLLNLCYESDDICYLYNYEIIEILFKSFVNFLPNSNENISLNLKFISFNWFKLLTLKICENLHLDQLKGFQNENLHQIKTFVFNQFILNQIKELKQILPNDNQSIDLVKLENISIGWFNHILTTDKKSKYEIELYLNQFLVVLLECIYLYEHIRLTCANNNNNYIEECLDIYYKSKSQSTILLTLKILGELISSLTNISNEKLIEKFLIDILIFIGQNSEQSLIINELIQTYRLIIQRKSSYQIMAIQIIFNSLNRNLNEINQLIASLAILGGYIQPFSLASIVKVFTNKDKFQLGIIIEIDRDSSLYKVQYLDTNQNEFVNIERLQIESKISPPDLLLLPNGNELIDSILDKLVYFIQIENNSHLFLQIKRQALSALFYLLNNQKMIELFLEKPYASIIAKLTIHPQSIKQSIDSSVFNKEHLERYYLSQKKNFVDNDCEIIRNENIIDFLSTSVWKYNGWKPYVSKADIQLFNHGRLGNNLMSIVSLPSNTASVEVLQQCGNKHRFKGKICSTSTNTYVRFPTFIIENLRVNQGNWYFCVKLLVGQLIQIGWATDGFSPAGDNGIGDDLYSWSYDGSRNALFHIQQFPTRFITPWKSNDVCGCGIEINGENINIKYWLNGKLLGTAFTHQQNISSSSTKCNLLPNGPTTTYFPGISLQSYCDPPTTCQFIFSPEDMIECPLPQGYKPLLIPQLINIENSIVAYPFNAYLIGDNTEDYFYQTRTNLSKRFLRDFVNENHLETEFINFDEHHLILSKDSSGFPLSIDNDISSFTITFHFQIPTHQQTNIQLLSFDTPDNISIEILLDKLEETIIITVHLKEQQIIVYTKNKSQIFNIKLSNETFSKFNIYLLPKIDAKLNNVAFWKYDLSQEHIQRLFTYGLFYLSTDYQQLKEHKKRMNTFVFTQHEFQNELLVPFDQPFQEQIWEKKKKQADSNESNYFKSSKIQLYGNKTYLILDKSNDQWLEYTIILDILIPNYPITNEQLSIITLNSKSQIYVTHQGKLCLTDDKTINESKSSLILNEYVRLFILIQRKCVKIYLNQSLEIDLSAIDDDRFAAKLNRFDLFREIDLTKNTTNDQTLRIECQSITFLNRSITIDELPNSSLETLVTPLISSSLIAIGYKESWIKSVIEQYKITNIQMIDTILRQQREKFIEIDFNNEQKRYLKIFSRLISSIDKEKLEKWFRDSKLDLNEQIEFILTHLNDFQSENQSLQINNQIEFDENKWFWQTVHHLDINQNLNEWIKDKTKITNVIENITSNSNTNQTRRLWLDDDDDDDDDEPQSPDVFRMITNLFSRQGETDSNPTVNVNDRDGLDCTLIDLTQLEQSIGFAEQPNFNSHIICEHALITMYARCTIQNIIEIWSNNSMNLFPLEKFGDYTFIVKLLRIMNDHFIYTNSYEDKTIDTINLLIKSNLKSEIKLIIENKISLFSHLHKNLLLQLIQLIAEPSLFDEQPNVEFIFKILNIFIELIKDKSFSKLDIIVQYLFPECLINLLFDLFLLIPTHQSKIFILRLFSKLIQTTERFSLKQEIQNFLFKLLIELSSNLTEMTKHFQRSLMDLVFQLLIKQDSCLQRTELPENIRNLLTVIEVINAFTDKSKKKLIPDEFFTQLEHKLTQEDFEKCNKHFDQIIDQQLIDLINKSPSFEEFSTTFIPTSTSLSNIPIDCIQIRSQFLYQLNLFIAKVLPLVDLNLSSEQSFVTDQIRTAKLYLFHKMKFSLLQMCLEKTEVQRNEGILQVSFDTIKSNENTMFYQAYEQLFTNAQIHFRKKARQIWQAIYVGMHSTDQGGPYRDSITQICSDICSTRLPLFILCPNGRTNVGLNKDCWIPNVFPPNKPIPDELRKQYQFVGQLMGLAIRKKHYLDLKFPSLLWKQLLKEPITIEDIQAIDIQSFTIINEIEKNIEQTISTDGNTDINDIFSSIISELRFEVVGSDGQTYELIPNGTNIPITSHNFKQYSSCYRQYRLNEFQRQIQFIHQGLCSIVPFYSLNLLTSDELEQAVCGKGQIDIELLKRNTQYSGSQDPNSPHIQRFWTVIGEMFNEEQRKLFLTFVWGRNTLPSRDQDFTMKFTINQYPVDDDDDVDKVLPRSHTCVFSLDLPEYSTAEIMYERLNYAITNCSSIDGDENFNEDPNTVNLFADSDSDGW